MKSGVEYMMFLADWYPKQRWKRSWFLPNWWRNLGDFPNLCSANVVSGYGKCMRYSVLELFLSDFQILPTSYGSLFWSCSERKITWGKLDITTPGNSSLKVMLRFVLH